MNEEVTTAESDLIDSELPKDDTILGSVTKLVFTLASTEVACAELGSVLELRVVSGLDSVEVTCSEVLTGGTDLGSVMELWVVTKLDSTEVTCSEVLVDGMEFGSVVEL